MSLSGQGPARGLGLHRWVGGWGGGRGAGRLRRRRREGGGLSPGLDPLESRTLLSNTAAPIMGPPPAASLAPVASETTWNLQLQPGAGGAGALSTLLPAISAAGASIGATPVQGLYVVHGSPTAMAALGNRLATTPGVAYAGPQHVMSIAATPN